MVWSCILRRRGGRTEQDRAEGLTRRRGRGGMFGGGSHRTNFRSCAGPGEERIRLPLPTLRTCQVLPRTRRELEAEGYRFTDLKQCPCGATMELWRAPKGDLLPLNQMAGDDAPAVNHFRTCARAAQFRRQTPSDVEQAAAAPAQTRPERPDGPSQASHLSTARAAIQQARRRSGRR